MQLLAQHMVARPAIPSWFVLPSIFLMAVVYIMTSFVTLRDVITRPNPLKQTDINNLCRFWSVRRIPDSSPAAQEVAPTNLLFPTGKHSEIDLICRQLPCAAGDCTAFIVCQANPSKSATTFMHNM